MQALREEAKAADYTGIRINSGISRSAAHEFYRRLGCNEKADQKRFYWGFQRKGEQMMIEPLTQQYALEIAKDWHYEAPYDFYDMKMTQKIMKKWFPLKRVETVIIKWCEKGNSMDFSSGNSGLYHGKFCAPSHKPIRC